MATSSRKKSGDRVPTGISGLDSLIDGGFKRGSIVNVSGDPGSGKTTLAMEFLYNGAKKYGEPGVFLSFEQSRDSLLDSLANYGWDVEGLEKKKKLRILTFQPHDAENFQNHEITISGIVEEMKATRLSLDSLTSIIMSFKTKARARQGLIRFLDRLRGWGVTAILTSESTTDIQGNVHSPFRIDFLTDAAIYLYNMRRDNYRLHAIEVVKMRGSSINSKLCPLKFGKGGIDVYPGQTVFR